LVTCQQADSMGGLVPSIQQLSLDCDDLLALITEDQFNITVTDTNVSPSNFNGSETGTLVTLDAGPFTVTEEPYDSVAEDVESIDDIQTNVTGPFPSFSEDCTQTGIGSFSSTGDIAAGGQETCNIINTFTIKDPRTILTVTKDVKCIPADPTSLDACNRLLGLIKPGSFGFKIIGNNNNPQPSTFTGVAPPTGQPVEIGPGAFVLIEDTIPTHEGFDLETTFTGGSCIQTAPTQAQGAKIENTPDKCDVVNTFTEEEDDFTVATSSITAQGTADSHELTAMEKITKLKTQWLNQLS
ncbi:MAG: hypothetical protein AB7P56_08385, partial [Nitrososphaeraceae archaeon]